MFTPPPLAVSGDRVHHAQAAVRNSAVADHASGVLLDALSGDVEVDRILLKAAAGAGKSYVLRRLVADAVGSPAVPPGGADRVPEPSGLAAGHCSWAGVGPRPRVPVRRQGHAAAGPGRGAPTRRRGLGDGRRPDRRRGADRHLPQARRLLHADAAARSIRPGRQRCGGVRRPVRRRGLAAAAPPFRQGLGGGAYHLGVGDVGQLPPLEVGQNPWRGDPRHNPFRAWPTEYDDDARTGPLELPAVWRPAAGQLNLWRAFYPEWGELHCVAAPEDRRLVVQGSVWGRRRRVDTGRHRRPDTARGRRTARRRRRPMLTSP